MVKRCANPECAHEFRHLNTGDLYMLDRASADTRFVWLCAECAATMAVSINSAGEVSVGRQRGSTTRMPANRAARLRLFSGCRPVASTHSGPGLAHGEAA